jgi:hypothetical protein
MMVMMRMIMMRAVTCGLVTAAINGLLCQYLQ